MFTYTASEILEAAKFYANVRNSDILDFAGATILLNEEYNRLYTDVIRETRAFSNYIEFEGNETELPDDCYEVYNVMVDNSPIEVSPNGQYIPGTYYIENNILHIIGSTSNTKRVYYAPKPVTITTPDEMVETDIPSDATITKVTSDYIYYTDTNSDNYKYVIANGASESEESAQTPSTSEVFLDGTIDFSDLTSITYTSDGDTEDVTSYFTRDDVTISNFVVSDPYIMVSYSDNKIYIFTGFDGTEWNPKISSGKNTYGEILGLYTDDRTGKGCVYNDGVNDHLYYASFVPDTILEYPNQIFFTLLEYRLAAKLCMLTNQEPGYLLNNMLEEAEVTFYSTLSKNAASGFRVRNVNERKSLLMTGD